MTADAIQASLAAAGLSAEVVTTGHIIEGKSALEICSRPPSRNLWQKLTTRNDTQQSLFRMWSHLADIVELSGYWPVVVGDTRLNELLERPDLEDRRSLKEVLEASRASTLESHYRREYEVSGELHEPELIRDAEAWLAANPKQVRATPAWEHLTSKSRLYLLPLQSSFDFVGIVKFGGWNECPPPEVHVSLLKEWESTYGASLLFLSNDELALRVIRHPSDRRTAMDLALRMHLYCGDFSQFIGDFGAVADTLTCESVWYFWWD